MLWKESLDHGFKYESTASILKNDDGTWAVVTRGDFEYLCLSYYDNDGNELSFHKTEIGNLGIWNVARLGDGYIVQLGDMMLRDTAHLYKMDRDGNLTDDFSYEADGYLYFIQDMIEFGGKVYISAFYVPMNEGTHVGGSRPEIANILNYCFESEDPTKEISSEELTPVVRKNFTAVLLICNPENGLLSTFYSVKGSLGAELSINDSGDLEWMVQSFLSTYYSPWTSSFTIGGICKEYCYEFDSAGNLVGQIDTNNQVSFRR